MFSLFKRILRVFLLSIIAVLLHFFAVSLFPYPLNLVNISLSIIIINLIISNRPQILWLAFMIGFLTEFFITVGFGVNLSALIITTFLIYWLYNYIFTNRSIYMTVVLTTISITVYHFLFLLGSLVLSVFQNINLPFFNFEIIINLGWEIIITNILTIILYLIFVGILKYLRPEYLNERKLYERYF